MIIYPYMAFLRIMKPSGRGSYYYIVESRRKGDRIRQKVLEYLGRDPDPEKLKRALRYWRVRSKVVRKEVPR